MVAIIVGTYYVFFDQQALMEVFGGPGFVPNNPGRFSNKGVYTMTGLYWKCFEAFCGTFIITLILRFFLESRASRND